MNGLLDFVFGVTGHVGWGQECARAAVIFVYGLGVVRVLGRRIFGKWSALDIVVAIVTGANLSRALTGSADLIGTLLATTLLMALHAILSHGAARWSALSRLVEGQRIMLGANGSVDGRSLVRHNISHADLQEALRSGHRRREREPAGGAGA